MKALFLVALLGLNGCAVYDNLSEGEKKAVIIGGSIIVAGAIIAHSNDPDITYQKVCINKYKNC